MGISERLELRHLRCFVAVAEELNFRRAAERLHLSQPPLSRTIAQFEDVLGAPLLDRSRRHCALTPLGERVLVQARGLLERLESAARQWSEGAHAAARTPRQLRLGLFFAMNPERFPLLERGLAERLGPTQIELQVARTHELIPQLRRGSLDAAIVMLPADLHELKATAVVCTEMFALLPASHALARQRVVAVADLAQLPRFLFMSRQENPPLYRHLDAALRQRGLAKPRYVVGRDTFSALADVAAGKACAVVCRTMAGAARRDIVFRRLRRADRLPIELALVSRAGLSAALRSGIEDAARAYLAPYAIAGAAG